MLIRLLAACSCAVVLAATVGAQSAQDVTVRRVPFFAPVITLPLTPSSLRRGMAELAWAVRLPIGYEAPGDERLPPMPPAFTLKTEGQTVRQLLDAIVVRQPRYSWTVDNGVVHLRPTAAVTDTANVLNQRIEGFAVDDVTLGTALREIHFTLRPEARKGAIVGAGPGPSALGLHRFSVVVGPTTIQGVLDAIVKAHGASSWSVTYASVVGLARPYRISFHTFDGWTTTW
jgi:hypothetical protein